MSDLVEDYEQRLRRPRKPSRGKASDGEDDEEEKTLIAKEIERLQREVLGGLGKRK